MSKKLCHCSKPLHYTDKEAEQTVTELSDRLGEYMQVTNITNHKTYLVQRHFIALHGIKGKDLATLGFEEYKPDDSLRNSQVRRRRR